MKEIEVKAIVRDSALLAAKLSELGVRLSDPIVQRDVVYFPKGIPFESQSRAKALRIRESNGKYLFTYKVPLANNLDKLEHESGIDNPQAMGAICEELGFELKFRISKVRRKGEHRGYEICVDEVDELGSYIEVEKLSEDGDSEKIQDEIFAFMQTLGIEPGDRVYEGYDLLLYKKQNTHQH